MQTNIIPFALFIIKNESKINVLLYCLYGTLLLCELKKQAILKLTAIISTDKSDSLHLPGQQYSPEALEYSACPRTEHNTDPNKWQPVVQNEQCPGRRHIWQPSC